MASASKVKRSARSGKQGGDDDTLGGLCDSFGNLCAGGRKIAVKKDSQQQQHQPDTLDYVFDHVESLVCKEENTTGAVPLAEDILTDLERDNSLLEMNSHGQAEKLETQRKIRRKNNPSEPDLLDYVFENVESFVCNHEPERKKSPRSDVTASTEPNDSYDQEDEILLVFRPRSYRVT